MTLSRSRKLYSSYFEHREVVGASEVGSHFNLKKIYRGFGKFYRPKNIFHQILVTSEISNRAAQVFELGAGDTRLS